MEESKPYSFRPNPFEQEYLDKNGLGFSDFVHRAFYKEMKSDFYERINKLSNRIFVVLIGLIVLSLSYVVKVSMLWVLWFVVGMVMVIFGFILLGLEARNHAR